MKEPTSSFSLIPLAEFYNQRRDIEGERIRVHELLDPDPDFDPTQPHDSQRIIKGFATNETLRRHNQAVTFLAGIITAQADELFRRDKIDFHILSSSLGSTGLRAIGILREDYTYPAIINDEIAGWWEINPIPINGPSSLERAPQYITSGFFTRWPSNHDLRKLIADSLTKPE